MAAQPATTKVDVEAGDGALTQTVQTQLRLRELILRGELAAGSRITELPLVERLGVSRTPIRAALIRLEQEGLLEAWPTGGYRVRRISVDDILDAIEVRGTLEGLAARLAAERGVDPEALHEAHECVAQIDAVLRREPFDAHAFEGYVAGNERLHALLAAMAGSAVVSRQLERALAQPFASPNAFMAVQAAAPGARDMLRVAQDQHQQVLDAIEHREGARAEAIMREHARFARRNLERALRDQPSLRLIPGGALIHPSRTETRRTSRR
jgi:GntR family transcriptional regulator of vanillate catabolism